MIHLKRFDPHAQRAGVCTRRTVAGQALGRWSDSRWAHLGALAVTLVFTNPALATEPATPSSVPDPIATTLFRAAVDLLEKNEWIEACSKFEASMALYPAASTLLNIARCYEHEGKLTLAWSAYQRAIVLNRETQGEERKKELDEVAKKLLAAIEPRLPRVKILMVGVVPSGLRVTQNGKDVPVAVLGTVLPVDPGQQAVVAEAPEFEPFARTVTVKEGEPVVEIPITLKKRLVTVVEKPVRAVPMWAWISAGGGVALLAGAAAFRVDQAFVEGQQLGFCNGDVQTSCPPKTEYDPTDDNKRKNRDSGLFIGLGTLGVLGLGAAVVGFVMGQPSKAPPKKAAVVVPWVGPSGVGLGVGGRF